MKDIGGGLFDVRWELPDWFGQRKDSCDILTAEHTVADCLGPPCRRHHPLTERDIMPEPQTHQTTQVVLPVQALVGKLAERIRESLYEKGPTTASVLEWLKTQDTKVIRQAIRETQPKGWAVASEPLIDSLTDDQSIGVLAALVAVFVQTV